RLDHELAAGVVSRTFVRRICCAERGPCLRARQARESRTRVAVAGVSVFFHQSTSRTPRFRSAEADAPCGERDAGNCVRHGTPRCCYRADRRYSRGIRMRPYPRYAMTTLLLVLATLSPLVLKYVSAGTPRVILEHVEIID